MAEGYDVSKQCLSSAGARRASADGIGETDFRESMGRVARAGGFHQINEAFGGLSPSDEGGSAESETSVTGASVGGVASGGRGSGYG